MKKIFLILSIIALSVSCTSKYEDDVVELGNRIDKLEQKIPTIEQQISAIDESITLLKQTDEALRAKDEQLATEDEKLKMAIQELEILIAELEKYVIYPAKDWAEATFYTLKQYNAAVSTLAKLEQSVASSDDATTKEISDAISALQASFQTWVGKELSGYYSIARADAEFAALRQSIESGDQTLQGEIDDVESQIASSATELEKEYQAAIETAIEEYNGTITAELKSQLDDVNKRIDEQVAAINDKLDALEAQIGKNSEDIAKLLTRIQSLSYVHKYADGKATMRQLNDLRHAVLQFEVSPKESVAALAESWENVLSVRGICPSDDGIIFDVDMPILKFETDEENGIISITISGENYPDWIFAEKEETMVVLTISNGATTFTTDYIPMAIRDYGGYDELIMPSNEIWYTTSDEQPIALHDDEPFNTEVLSNTYENGFGRIVTDGEIKSLSYNTFSDAQLLSITIPDSVSNIADGTFNAGSIVEFRYKHASQDGRSIIMNNRLVAVAAGGLTEYTIPDSVTEIGDYTFYNCYSLESVTIPDRITEIGKRAFYMCISLKSITIPDSVTTIGREAFGGCGGELIINNRKLVETDYEWNSYPSGQWLDSSAFTKLTIGDNITKIGDRVFYNCNSLTSVTIPESVTSIGYMAFYSCYSLKSVIIPDSVTSIGGGAFNECTSLESITIGNGVTSIGASAFADCTSLTSFTIPESVIEIGYRAFRGCTGELIINNKIVETNYTKDDYPEGYRWLSGSNFTKLTIGNNVTKIGDYVFYRYKSLTSITIPDSVTEIGEGAFRLCDSLISITIPDSVISIGDYAFYDCTSLKSITIGNGVNEIVGHVFGGCKLLKRVDISDLSAWCRIKFDIEVSATGISATNPLSYGAELYLNGTLVTDVVIPSDITHISDVAFLGCSSLTSVTIPDSVTSIGDYAFYGCTSLESVTIPDSVTAIGDRAFNGCGVLNRTNIHLSKLEDFMTNRKMYEDIPSKYLYVNGQEVVDMVVPDGVTTIENKAFRGLACLKSVTIPLSVTAIGDYAFEGCIGLTSVNLAKTVTSIGSYAFANCTGLTSCNIPVSVTSIGYKAFANCINIPSFEISASVNFIGAMAFSGCTGELIINNKIVETNYTKDDYPEGYRWLSGSNFTKLTIGNNVTKIGDYVFYWCDSLRSITIPDSVTSIGDYAFQYCTLLKSVYISDIAEWCRIDFVSSRSNPLYYAHNLYLNGELVTNLVIPDGVTSIKDYAFYNCTSLESITIGNGVTTIGGYAFYDCDSLTSLTIPDSVTTIGGYAFYDCDSLTSVTIPDSVTEIGDKAFRSCINLREVYCKPTTPPSIGEYTFASSEIKIYVPTASVNAYKSALNWSYYSSMINRYNFE